MSKSVEGRERRATSTDVARAAGVSRATVSFVLNSTPNQTIPAATRNRVLEAAAHLEYIPSAEARTLKRGHSNVVLVQLPAELPLTPDVGVLLEYLAAAFSRHGLAVIIQPSGPLSAADIWQVITPTVVIAWRMEPSVIRAMKRNGVQVVLALSSPDNTVGQWVLGARELAIATAQVARLNAAGHRHLGYAMPDAARMALASAGRLQALILACRALGLPKPLALPVNTDPLESARALGPWCWQGSPVTGVCAHDTTTALSVLAGLRRRGLSVPADMAVVGVSDSTSAALSNPPLTMVDVDMEATAQFVVEVVLTLLNGSPPPPPPTVVATLVERASV